MMTPVVCHLVYTYYVYQLYTEYREVEQLRWVDCERPGACFCIIRCPLCVVVVYPAVEIRILYWEVHTWYQQQKNERFSA